MRLKNKVAVVTGGTSGIGRAIVERYVQEGALVVFSGRRADLGEEVSKATGALFVEADVCVEADAVRTVKTAFDAHGRLDVLVNNAGMGSPRSVRIENTPLEFLDKMMAGSRPRRAGAYEAGERDHARARRRQHDQHRFGRGPAGRFRLAVL